MADGVQRHVGLQFVYRRMCAAAIEEAARLMAFDFLLDPEDVDVALVLLMLATRRFEVRQAQDQVNHILIADLWRNTSAGEPQYEEKLHQLAQRYPALDGCVPGIVAWYRASSRFALVEMLLMRRGFIGEKDQFGAVRVRSCQALGILQEPAVLYAFTTPVERRRRYATYWAACKLFYRESPKEEERSQGLITRLDVVSGAATRVWAAGQDCFLLLHCPGRFLPAFQRHLRALYPKVLGTVLSTNFRDVCTGVALLHYWLAQAALYKRGSASIAEMFALALFRAFQQSAATTDSHGSGSCWTAPDHFRAGLMPDLEAFFRPKGEFVALYPTFVAWSERPVAPLGNPRFTVRSDAESGDWVVSADGCGGDPPSISGLKVDPRWQSLLDEPMVLHRRLGSCRPKAAPSGPIWQHLCSHTWPPSKYDTYRADAAQLEQWQTLHCTVRNFRID
eukprot:GGOE01041915.1.p1 GENE.GGOE01041915.1~~GGOE01041915.1.p1  ORF type:complete len:456 (+),score=108.15 GGOE01041915.1:23-1369(+)